MAVMIVPKRFRALCGRCLLELEYDASDVSFDKKENRSVVTCPVCGALVPHDPNNVILPPEPLPEAPRKKVDPGNPYADN